jgi:hypothetical protein
MRLLNRREISSQSPALVEGEKGFVTRNMRRQILITHFVERADNAVFEDRPKTLNREGMHGGNDERFSRTSGATSATDF